MTKHANDHVSLVEIRLCLTGHLDRIETDRVKAHCRECEECRRILNRMMEGRIEKGWYVAEGPPCASCCFSGDTLRKYNTEPSDLTDQERTVIEQHLQSCPACQDLLNRVCWADEMAQEWEEVDDVQEAYDEERLHSANTHSLDSTRIAPLRIEDLSKCSSTTLLTLTKRSPVSVSPKISLRDWPGFNYVPWAHELIIVQIPQDKPDVVTYCAQIIPGAEQSGNHVLRVILVDRQTGRHYFVKLTASEPVEDFESPGLSPDLAKFNVEIHLDN